MKKIILITIAVAALVGIASISSKAQRRGSFNPYSSSYSKTNDSTQHHFRQIGLGVEAGLNYSNVTGGSSINSSSRSGFMAGIVYMPGGFTSHIFGYRTELIFSQQGYNFSSNTTTGNVKLNYLIMPHQMIINITKYVQLQIGGQTAYLLNAKADSSAKGNSFFDTSSQTKSIASFYNKFIFGFAGGVEIHPYKGIMLGAKANFNFNSINKTSTDGMPQYPTLVPSKEQLKNNVFQLYIGYCF